MTTQPISSLRQRMIWDMNARKRGRHCQRSHLGSCERFAAFLQRSPETATADDVRRFQLHLAESGHRHLQSQPDHDGCEVPAQGDAAPA